MNDIALDRERLLCARATRLMFGDISDMSLWRWCHDPTISFPAPIIIAKRRYWRLGDLIEFRDRHYAPSRFCPSPSLVEKTSPQPVAGDFARGEK